MLDTEGSGMPGSGRQCAGQGGPAERLHQHLVELSVVGAGENNDPVAARHGPGDPHGRHDGFRAGVAEGDTLVARHPADCRRNLSRERRLRADREALVHLLADRRRPRNQAHGRRRSGRYPLTRSMYSFPSTSQIFDPLERAQTMG